MTINHGLFGFPIRSYKYAAIFTLYFEIPPLVRLHRPVYGRIHCIQNIMEITMPTRVYLHTNLVPRKCDRRISYITYRSITLCDIITTCKVVNNVVIARVLPVKGSFCHFFHNLNIWLIIAEGGTLPHNSGCFKSFKTIVQRFSFVAVEQVRVIMLVRHNVALDDFRPLKDSLSEHIGAYPP